MHEYVYVYKHISVGVVGAGKVGMIHFCSFAALPIANPWVNAADEPMINTAADPSDGARANNRNTPAPSAPVLQPVQYEDGMAVGVHCQIVAKRGFQAGKLLNEKETGARHNLFVIK